MQGRRPRSWPVTEKMVTDRYWAYIYQKCVNHEKNTGFPVSAQFMENEIMSFDDKRIAMANARRTEMVKASAFKSNS